MKKSLLMLILGSILLVSCGKTGALYLPKDSSQESHDQEESNNSQ